MSKAAVSVGDQVFLHEGAEVFGSVRYVHPHELVIYVEGSGEHTIAAASVVAAHDGKVILEEVGLSAGLKLAIRAAHRKEEPGL